MCRGSKRSPTSDDDERDSKRDRVLSDVSSREFEARRMEPAFRDAHHPERVVAGLLERRNMALAALPGFVADMKAAVLPGPRTKSPFPESVLTKLSVSDGPATSEITSRLVKIDPVPASVAAHAVFQVMAAAAPPAASESAGLQAVLFSEPLRYRTRLWALYGTEEQAEAAHEPLAKLPQLDELVELPSFQTDSLIMAAKPPLAQLTEEKALECLSRCEQLARALDSRLDLEGSLETATADLPDLKGTERLAVLIMYLRRVHCFDFLGGRQHLSQFDVVGMGVCRSI